MEIKLTADIAYREIKEYIEGWDLKGVHFNIMHDVNKGIPIDNIITQRLNLIDAYILHCSNNNFVNMQAVQLHLKKLYIDYCNTNNLQQLVSRYEIDKDKVAPGVTIDKKTYDLIRNEIDAIDKNKGWKYAFRNESDMNAFINIIGAYFEGSEYTLPTNLISLNHGSKTRFAPIFRSVYYACDKSKIDLSKNKSYFELIKIIEDYSEDADGKLYKSIMKVNK